MWGWFKGLSQGRQIAVSIISLFVLGTIASAASPASKPSSPPASTKPTTTHGVKAENIQFKNVIQTKDIPFQSITHNDSSLASGTTKITTTGVNGVETITYKVTYSNNIETSREKLSDEITTQPINQITAVGTYIAPVQNCPNGTYVNTAGNTVCSPYSAPSAPAGATAKCLDDTYSFSQSRSGTCSHHGGVSAWL